MEWLSVVKELGPVTGPLVAILLVLLAWEKKEHKDTRSALSACQNKRVDEAIKMTTVIEGSSAAANARTESTKEQTEAFRNLTMMVQTSFARGGGKNQ